MQSGGGIYTESDILPMNDPRLPKDKVTGESKKGGVRTLSNGALAGYVVDKNNNHKVVFRVIKGVKTMKKREDGTEFNQGMQKLRSLRGKTYAGVTKDNKRCRDEKGKLRPNAPIGCEITATEAEHAFNKHYHRKYFGSSKKAVEMRKKIAEKVDKTVYKISHPKSKKKIEVLGVNLKPLTRSNKINNILRRRMKLAMDKDIQHRAADVHMRNNRSYLLNPGLFDYEGVDAPQKEGYLRKKRTEKQLANDRRMKDRFEQARKKKSVEEPIPPPIVPIVKKPVDDHHVEEEPVDDHHVEEENPVLENIESPAAKALLQMFSPVSGARGPAKKKPERNPRKSPKRGPGKKKKKANNQLGGNTNISPISLNTAVHLLKEYYQ